MSHLSRIMRATSFLILPPFWISCGIINGKADTADNRDVVNAGSSNGSQEQCENKGNSKETTIECPSKVALPEIAPIQTDKQIWKLAASDNYVCALGKFGLKCWRSNSTSDDYLTTLPKTLVNPRDISLSNYHACALDDNGVQCWGLHQEGQTEVPNLVNPQVISTGGSHACTLSESGASCWGSNVFGQINVPPLVKPTFISAGETHSCAVDEGKVVCWGGAPGYQYGVIPDVKNVTQMEGGNCTVSSGELRCWSQNSGASAINEHVKAISSIARANGFICATGNEVLANKTGNEATGKVNAFCFGNSEPGTTVIPADLQNPRSIVGGISFACVIEHDRDKIKCWGKDITNGYFKIPEIVPQ